MTDISAMTLREAMRLIKKHGSGRRAAQALGVPRTTFQDHVVDLKKDKFTSRAARKPVAVKRPQTGGIKRFIFTSAQDGTEVHEGFLNNLEAYSEYFGAPIYIAGFTYNKSLFEDTTRARAVFHPSILKYMTTEQIDIAGKLLFCGEMNIIPTSTDPLSGFETYTRKKWGVFPHPRVQLQSVATMFNEPAKIIMTTGAVTKANYVQKKAGIKAEFHHVIGAVIVEVDSDGDVFARHLIAEQTGAFQDLTHYVSDGVVSLKPSVEAVTWGDIHAEQIDAKVLDGCFDGMGMLDALGPRYQFFHDVSDFTARNHHTLKNSHEVYRLHASGTETVEDGIKRVGEFLDLSHRVWCQGIVVYSNHDDMLRRWLAEGDYRRDPVNAIFFLEQQLAMYRAMKREADDGYAGYSPLEWALYGNWDIPKAVFLSNTDSFAICNDSIECALHGHQGSNGSKGQIRQFARMGSKANIGHTHSAGIYEGIYQAGTCSKLDLGYNRGGLSSWNHSHIVTYNNGKRCIVTMQGIKWRA